MTIQVKGQTLRMNKRLIQIIEEELEAVENFSHHCVLNFRDPDYNPDSGGYHPVEIMISKSGEIQYITDFSYAGIGEYAELVKDIDFDFTAGIVEQYGRIYRIEACKDLFTIYQDNFIAYYKMGVYQVSISCE